MTTNVAATLTVEPVVAVAVQIKSTRRRRPRRSYVWLTDLAGNRQGVIR